MRVLLADLEIAGSVDEIALQLPVLPAQLEERVRTAASTRTRAARMLARVLAADCLAHASPVRSLADVRIADSGRPELDGIDDITWSHSGRIVAAAYSNSGAIGIDVQAIVHGTDAGSFAPFLAIDERATLGRVCSPSEELARMWATKEAVLKACGLGVTPSLAASISTMSVPISCAGHSWYATGLPCTPGHVAALASTRPLMVVESARRSTSPWHELVLAEA